jgi:6-phosphogluconolactonase
MSLSFEVVEDPARTCAALLVGAAIGGGEIVLAGGSTPQAAYEHFGDAVTAAGLDLSGSRFWMGDERCVDPEDELSNYRMVKESLIDPLKGITTVDVERIPAEHGPEAAADDYERRLRSAGPASFDLVLLGIGPDGHTASLFPAQPALAERTRLVVGVPEAGLEPFVPRVSLTVNALTSSERIVVLAAGASKAAAIAEAFAPDSNPTPTVPASLLVPEAKVITVLIDHAAAGRLGPGV